MSFDLVPTGARITDRSKCCNFSGWDWRPLVFYTWMLAPRFVTLAWHTNDGEKVSKHTAELLADLIDDEIASGRAAEFAQAYNRTCNAAVVPRGGPSMYPFDLGNLQRFSAFCRASGGFTID